MKTPYIYLTHWWRTWPFKWSTILILLSFIIIISTLAVTHQPSTSIVKKTSLPQVSAVSLSELTKTNEISISGTLEPSTVAPLIARTGGRITALHFNLGSHIVAGTTIASVDTGIVANPTNAQITGLSHSLSIVTKLSKIAKEAAELAVSQAQANLNTVKNVQPFSLEQARIARRQADLQVENTRLTLSDARDSSNDNIIRVSDIANQAAGLAQDQTTIGLKLAQKQTQLTVNQATLALQSAQAAHDRVISETSLQAVQLQTQIDVAQQQFKLQQISSPVTGEITRLSIQPGSYVTPGKIVGEVNALSGARITLNVSTGVRNQLTLGQTVTIKANNQSFTGNISQFANTPYSNSGLWQIDIMVEATPSVVHPGSTVTVSLPVGRISSDNFYVPLDALVVRQTGIYIFTVKADKAIKHPVTVIGYDAAFAEIQTNLASDTLIITKGNRTLRDGEDITVNLPR